MVFDSKLFGFAHHYFKLADFIYRWRNKEGVFFFIEVFSALFDVTRRSQVRPQTVKYTFLLIKNHIALLDPVVDSTRHCRFALARPVIFANRKTTTDLLGSIHAYARERKAAWHAPARIRL